MSKRKSTSEIPAALKVIDALRESEIPLTAAELSTRSGLSSERVLYIADRVISELVLKDSTGRYRLLDLPQHDEIQQVRDLPKVEPSNLSARRDVSEKVEVHLDDELTINHQDLPEASTKEEFELHCAAVEWSLADPIIIRSAKDIQSRVDWCEMVEPYEHQVLNLMSFCRRLPASIIADDVGLGKTISAGLIVAELLKRRRINRVLVVCPAILCNQWVDELLGKFNIDGVAVKGGGVIPALRGNTTVVVTTYDSIKNRFDRIPPGTIDMLILDEAHKLRNLHGPSKPPIVAKRFSEALRNRLFQYVLMLTATPIQNDLWDIYSLIDLLSITKGHKNPLGIPASFRANFLTNRTGRELQKHKQSTFRKIVSEYLRRTRRADAKLLFPERVVELFRVAPQPIDVELQRIVARHISGLPPFQQSSLGVAMMSSPEAVLKQFETMAANHPRFQAAVGQIKSLLDRANNIPAKQKGLLSIVKQLREHRGDKFRLIIFTTRIETQKVIGKLLSHLGVSFGFIKGGQPQKNYEVMKRFQNDPPELNVIVSTDAGSEGVNLQQGNVLVNYDLPWNPMVVEQRIGRIQRLASPHKRVIIHNLTLAEGPEEKIVMRLMEKLQAIASTVGDVEGILESANRSKDSDSGASFQSQIRKMVVASLEGVDPTLAVKMTTESIDRAKKLIEENRSEIDRQLGRLDAAQADKVAMPHLNKTKPRLEYRDFVERALAFSNAMVSSDRPSVFRAEWPNRPSERFTFDENIWRNQADTGSFHGRRIELYQPGKPAFEKLVQHWIDRGGAYFRMQAGTPPDSFSLGKQYLAAFDGAEVNACNIGTKLNGFEGNLVFKAKIYNANDSYEKLVQMPVEIKANSQERSESVRRFLVDNKSAIRRLILADKDISAFRHFYQQRLENEIINAGTEPSAKQKLLYDLEPKDHVETAAFHGEHLSERVLSITYQIDGKGSYDSVLMLDSDTNEILKAPRVDTCQQTQRVFPEDALEHCSVTGKMVLTHLLKASEATGSLALPDHHLICAATGKSVLPKEAVTSAVSGKPILEMAASFSDVSHQPALTSELAKCDFTQSLCLPAEIRTSDFSKGNYRCDGNVTSTLSGKNGHESEFIECSASGKMIGKEEAEYSDVTNKPARPDLLQKSAKRPYRKGLPKEFATCSKSGAVLLVDEIEQCTVTEKTYDTDLLDTCPECGSLVYPDNFEMCAATQLLVCPSHLSTLTRTGEKALKENTAISIVSGARGLVEDFQVCEITGEKCLPEELVLSDVSGKQFRQDEQRESERTGRTGHETEIIECGFTGSQILRDEFIVSSLSNKRGYKRDFKTYEDRQLHISEFIVCSVSGLEFPRDECVASDVSGKYAKNDLIERSGISKGIGLPDEMLVCPDSKVKLLQTEAVTCGATGQLVNPNATTKCDASGKLFLKKHAVRLIRGGKFAIKSETHYCHWLCGYVPKSDTVKCSATNNYFHESCVKKQILDEAQRVLVGHGKSGNEKFNNMLKEISSGKIGKGYRTKYLTNETKSRLIVSASKINMFGSISHYYVCLVGADKATNYKLIGKLGVCKEKNGRWTFE